MPNAMRYTAMTSHDVERSDFIAKSPNNQVSIIPQTQARFIALGVVYTELFSMVGIESTKDRMTTGSTGSGSKCFG
jgi:hypothetical protein